MNLRACVTELVGTFLLVFVCAGVVVASKSDNHPIGVVGIALAQGCALAVLLTVTVKVSEGCLNPAVVLALWVTKRFDSGRAVGLIASQLLGGVFAGALIFAAFDSKLLTDSYVGTPHLKAFIAAEEKFTPGDWITGTLAEVVLTMLMTLAILSCVLDPRRVKWAALFVGLALTAAVLVGYDLSGASLNPARWFGTAVWQRSVADLQSRPVLRDHLPYWMGPIVGALLAAVVHAEWLKPDEKKG